MSLADLRKERLRRQEARRKARRQRRHERRAARAEAARQRPPIPFPTGPGWELRFLNEYCWWPHESTGKPVRGVYTQEDLDADAAFRLDEQGNRIGGSDCKRKPRKFKLTSRTLGRIFAHLLHAWLIRGEAWSSTSAFEVQKPEKLKPILRRVQSMLRNLPREWTQGVSTSGNTIAVKNGEGEVTGWVWNLIGAGASESSADRAGRGDTQHIVHMSESRAWPNYEQSVTSLLDSLPSDGSGWIVDETTFPVDEDHPAAKAYFDTKKGTGLFSKAHFWPWFWDPLKRIPRGSPDYLRVMRPDFPLRPEDAAAENRWQLDAEQCAFRRVKRCSGSLDKQRLACAEFPETEEDAFTTTGERWLAERVRAILRAQAIAAVPFKRDVGPMLAQVWRPTSPVRHVIAACDTYEFGADQQACVAIDRDTGDQLGQVHGQGLYEHFAQGVAWVLVQQGCGRIVDATKLDSAEGYQWDHSTYTLVVEVNRGRGFGARLEALGLELWVDPTPPGTKAGRKQQPEVDTAARRRWGVSTQRTNRYAFFDAVKEVLQGSDLDEHGEPLPSEPTCEVRSTVLMRQLCELVQGPNRVDVARGKDDLVMAFAIAQWTRARVHPKPVVDVAQAWSRMLAATPSTGALEDLPI